MAVKDFYLTNISKKMILAIGDFTVEDAKLFHDYRKKIPCLSADNPRAKGFIVDGRTLHKELGIKDHYRNWASDSRLNKKMGFMEGEDFRSFFLESSGGRPAKEHMFTLTAARQLAMISPGEKGILARRFFSLTVDLLEAFTEYHQARLAASEGAKKIADKLWSDLEEHEALQTKRDLDILMNRIVKGKYTDLPLTKSRTVLRDQASSEVNDLFHKMEDFIYNLLLAKIPVETIKTTLVNVFALGE